MNNQKIKAPDFAVLIGPLDGLYYLDCQSAFVDKNLSATDCYCLMTSGVPIWMDALFVLRDAMVRPFGLKPIGRFTAKPFPPSPLSPGQALDFFTVRRVEADCLVLTFEDSHLAVMICLQLQPQETGQTFFLTASVQVYNLLGKVYMAPVAVAHPTVVKWMCRKLERQHGAAKP